MMNPNELKKLKNHAPIPILFVIILCFLASMVMEPQRKLLQENIDNYDRSLSEIKKLRLQKIDFAKQASMLEKLEAANKSFWNRIPEEKSMPDVIQQFSKIASECGVKIERVSYSMYDEYEKMLIKNCELNMHLNSEYDGLRRMLEKIESLPVPVVIGEVRLDDNQNYILIVRLVVK